MQLLEHVHVNVDSLEETERFLSIAQPLMARRGGGFTEGFGNWMHLGTEDSYIAFTEVKGSSRAANLRHIGIVSDDVEALMQRLSAAGYEPADDSALDSHPHRRRVYYIDGNGLDWEFVEYLSADPAERNDYSH